MAGKDTKINTWASVDGADDQGKTTINVVHDRFQEATDYGDLVKTDLATFMTELQTLTQEPSAHKLTPDYPKPPEVVKMGEVPGQPDPPSFDDIPPSGDVINNLVLIDEPYDPVIKDIGNFEGTDPIDPIKPLNLNDIPELLETTDLVGLYEPELHDVPEYTGEDGSFDEPDLPGPFSDQVPDAPDSDFSMPSEPDLIDISTVDIVVPEVPEIEKYTFQGVRPDTKLVEPELNFSFDEEGNSFVSCIKEKLPAKICAIIDGSDPLILSEDTINDILQSAVEQFDIEAAKSYDETLDGWALKGWDIPQGAMIGRLDELRAEADRSKAGVIRDIGSKQSELAIDGLKAALTVGTQYEGLLIEHFNQIQTRAFEAAKIMQEAALSLFDAQVKKLNSSVELYTADAQVLDTLQKSNTSILDGYKTQMEGSRVRAEVEDTKVKATVAINESVINSYGVVVSSRVEIEKLKVARLSANIEGFNSKINAKTLEYSGHAEEVKAALAKVQAAETQVRAYNARVEGLTQRNNIEMQRLQATVEKNKGIAQGNSAEAEMFRAAVAGVMAMNEAESLSLKAQVDQNSAIAQTNSIKGDVFKIESEATIQGNNAEMLKLQADIEKNKGKAANNMSKVETFKAEVAATSEKNQAEEQRYSAEMSGFTESVKVALANYDGVLKEYVAKMSLWDVQSQLALGEAKEEIRVAIQEYELRLEAAKAAVGTYTQLAASSMNMVSASAGVSFSGTNSNSSSGDRTKQFETFHYQKSESISN